MRDCVLGLCDEVCIYHRENDIYDRVLKVGLRILKVQPVESKQPRPHRYASKLACEALRAGPPHLRGIDVSAIV